MSLKLSISEARARLTELAHRVMDTPGEIVIIEHRDRKERLVLTTESHYRALEAAVQDAKQKWGTAPFRLLGSLHSALTDEGLEAALAAARASQRAEDERRVQRLLED